MQTTASESGSATTAPSPHYRHVEPIGGEPEAGARAAVAAAAALAAEGRRNGVGDSNRRSSGDLLFPCIMPATLLLKAKGVLPTLASPSPPSRPPSPLLFLLKKNTLLYYTSAKLLLHSLPFLHFLLCLIGDPCPSWRRPVDRRCRGLRRRRPPPRPLHVRLPAPPRLFPFTPCRALAEPAT